VVSPSPMNRGRTHEQMQQLGEYTLEDLGGQEASLSLPKDA